jgi:rhodanese-related sulfurtransferase
MPVTLVVIVISALGLAVVWWIKRERELRTMEQHSITPEALRAAMLSNADILLFDVRQPLDLLAYPEIIPGAKRIAPDEVLRKPTLIPQEKDSIVYCTCPSDKTSRAILRRALSQNFSRIRFLRGGLAAWKALNYPVEKYEEAFHLYSSHLALPISERYF